MPSGFFFFVLNDTSLRLHTKQNDRWKGRKKAKRYMAEKQYFDAITSKVPKGESECVVMMGTGHNFGQMSGIHGKEGKGSSQKRFTLLPQPETT